MYDKLIGSKTRLNPENGTESQPDSLYVKDIVIEDVSIANYNYSDHYWINFEFKDYFIEKV